MKYFLTYFQAPRHLAAAVIAVSMAALAAAYVSQYGFGLKPCILCLYQRVPYWLNILVGLGALLATFRYPRIVMPLLLISALVFFSGAAIAGFHAGIEQKWWQGLASCGGNIIPKNASLEELRYALTHQAIVRCDEPAWTLLGISMAGYNFILSLALGLKILYLLRRNRA